MLMKVKGWHSIIMHKYDKSNHLLRDPTISLYGICLLNPFRERSLFKSIKPAKTDGILYHGEINQYPNFCFINHLHPPSNNSSSSEGYERQPKHIFCDWWNKSSRWISRNTWLQCDSLGLCHIICLPLAWASHKGAVPKTILILEVSCVQEKH